jgi:hypothetical protein
MTIPSKSNERWTHSHPTPRLRPETPTFQLADGVSVVHLVETEYGHDPLTDVRAFQCFREGSATAAREPLS